MSDIITKTNDGYVVELFTKAEIKSKVKEDFEGILILEPDKGLVEDELYSTYVEIVDKMDYKPVIIKAPEMQKEIKVLETQIRAMLRAATQGDLSIVFSKISTINEIREYKEILEKCQKELEVENTPYKKHMKIGIIIEIPSTALSAYEIARECDFFLIDTDSLTQYTFGNKNNLDLCHNLQLPIIKLVQQATEGAHDAGIFCGICGENVENELYLPLLIGVGIDQFSVKEENISKIRMKIHELGKDECKELVTEILQMRVIEDIERKLKQFMQN